MAKYTYLIVFYLLTLSSFCYGQFKVYRADTRTPEQIKKAGGFLPRGQSRALTVAPNISMFAHAIGASNGQSTDADGYVSTTVDEKTAKTFLGNFFQGTGHVYEIAAAPNFIQVAGTLGRHSPYPDEFEYAAIGGFRFEQVIGWTKYEKNVAKGKFVKNSAYNSRRYNKLRANPGEPSLAGFDVGHEAWLEAPWNKFAAPGCSRRVRRGVEKRQAGTCRPAQSNVQSATSYMSKACSGELC